MPSAPMRPWAHSGAQAQLLLVLQLGPRGALGQPVWKQQPARAQSVHKSLTVPQLSRSRSNSSQRQTSPCTVQRTEVSLGPVMEQTRGPSTAPGPPLPVGNLAGTNLATPPRLSCQTPERCYRDTSTLPERTGWDDHQECGSSISSECENQSLAHNGLHLYLEELKS